MADDFDKKLGKYLLKSQLGKGGMGVVYLATDDRLKRDVALKILPRQVSTNPEAVERFFQEARVLARLNHPHVVVVHDVGQENGYCYLVMELLQGGTVGDRLKRGPLPWPEATEAIAQACRGLAAAQSAGLVHRDIKPSNLMCTVDGVVKITDFGLAKITNDPSNKRLTKTGTVMGTPEYMSPEQCRGEVLDARSDIYSLGATYFALLTGDPPFAAVEPLQILFAHCSKPPPDLRALRPNIPSACADIVKKALAKNRGERYRNAQEMLEALTQLLNAAPTLAQKQLPVHVGNVPPEEDASATVNLRVPGTLADVGNKTQPLTRRPWRWPLRRWPLNRNKTFAAAAGCLLFVLLLGWTWRPRPLAAPAETNQTHAEQHQPVHLELLGELPVGDTMIRGLDFAEDGKTLFAGGSEGNVAQWDLASKKILRKYAGAKGTIFALGATPQWLVAGGLAKTLWLWRVDAAQPHTALELSAPISALCISPDGCKLAVGTYAEVRLYDLDREGLRLQKVLGTSATQPACYMVMSVAFSSDGRWVAATTWESKRALLWEVSTASLREASPSQADDPMTVTFVPGQERILMGLHHKGVVLWDVANKSATPLRSSADREVRRVLLANRTAVVIGEWGGAIYLYDLAKDESAQRIPGTAQTGTLAAALSKDAKYLAVGGGNDEGQKRGYLQLWNVTRGKAE